MNELLDEVPETLEEKISRLTELGLKVQNLFELDGVNGGWRANLRLDLKFEFGNGKTPGQALEDALRKILKEELRAEPGVNITTQLRLEDLDL